MKHIMALFIMFIIISGCRHKNSNVIEENEMLSSHIDIKYPTTISARAFEIIDTKSYGDSMLYFSDNYSHRVYSVNCNNSTIDLIGGYGSGPGEYINPHSLAINKDSLFVMDSGQNSVIIYDINGKYLKTKKYRINISDKKMTIANNGMEYFVNYLYQGNYIIAADGKSYYAQPKEMAKVEFPMINYYIQTSDSIVYFMNPYEMKLFYINVYNKKEGLIILKGTESRFDWEDDGNLAYSSKNFGKLLFESMVICPIRFFVSEYSGRKYYVVEAGNLKEKTVHLYFFNQEGHLIQKIRLDGFTLFVISGDKMIGLSYYKNYELKNIKTINIPDQIKSKILDIKK